MCVWGGGGVEYRVGVGMGDWMGVCVWVPPPHASSLFLEIPCWCARHDIHLFHLCASRLQATNRQHPQTVTGAFLSGVREAARVADMAL